MADNKLNDELRDNLDIVSKLKEALSNVTDEYAKESGLLDGINTIENQILNTTKKLSEEQQKRKSLQNQINALGDEFNQKIKDTASNETRLHEIIEQIKNKRSEIFEINKNIALQEAFETQQQKLFNEIGLGKAVKYMEEFNELVRENPWAAVLSIVSGLLHVFKNIFVELDSAAADFRINMGFIRSDTSELEKNVRAAHFELYQTGVTAKELYGAFQAIGQSIGTSQATTNQMAKDMALMAVQLGVSEATSAEFAKTMGMMGKSTMDAQKDISLFTSRLSAAAGTNLNDVMGDVAAKSETTYRFFVRNPLALAKAAVEARKMGTSLNDAARSANDLIQFTTSVENEMKASVLLGESINLQRVRELAYRKDLAGVNREILAIAQKTRFEELDPFQQESVAKALGKSADELGKMLQADREMRRIRSDGSLAKQVAEYDKLVGSNESIAKSTAENARNNLMNLSNQQSLKAISLALKSIYQTMFQPLVDLATIVLPKIAGWLQSIHEATNKWVAMFVGLAGIVALVTGPILLGKLVGWIKTGIFKKFGLEVKEAGSALKGGFAEGLAKGAKNIEQVFKSVGNVIIRLGASIGRGIGAVIQYTLMGIAAGLAALGAVAAEAGLGLLVLAGLAIVLIGFAYAAKLVAAALASLKDVDLLSIAAGLMAVGSASLLLIPVAPFLPLLASGFFALGIALRLAVGPMERVGIASMELGLGLTKTAAALEKIAGLSLIQVLSQFRNLATTISQISKEVNAIPDIKIEKIQDIITKSTGIAVQQAQKSDEEILAALAGIKTAVDALRNSMEKGGVAANVYIDTQKMDSITARTLAFKGTKTPQPAFV